MYSVLPVLNFYSFNTTIDILVFVYIYIQIDSRSYYMLCRYIYVCMYVYIYIYIYCGLLSWYMVYIYRETYIFTIYRHTTKYLKSSRVINIMDLAYSALTDYLPE